MSKRFFDNIDGADLPAFVNRLRHLIAVRLNTEIPPNSSTYVADFAAMSGQDPSAPLASCLALLGDLDACDLLDTLWHGKGTVTGKTQPYVLTLTDLRDLDPFCAAVSFLQFRKGNPWFAIDLEDVAQPDARVKIYNRRVRKKKVELTWERGMQSGDLGMFMWNWFGDAGLAHKSVFSDCADDADGLRALAQDIFANTITLSENTTLFEDDNTTMTLSWGSIGWNASFVIHDVFEPHCLTQGLMKHTSISIDAIQRMIDKDRATYTEQGSI